MIRNKVVINKDILLDLGFDKYYNGTLFDSYENKKHNTILIYKDRVEVYMGVHSRTFKPDDISRFIHFIKKYDK